jgi:hypothetical protein
VLYDLHARRGGTLILNGTDDDVVSMTKMGATFFDDLRKRTIALHGGAENVFDVDWVQGGGHRPYFVTRAAALWLEQRLEFPRWSAEKIARMPETHISEWAAANSVFIDRAYATELREGGTTALGDGVPPVARELLNALPAERWDQDRDRYIYESWVKRALKLLP